MNGSRQQPSLPDPERWSDRARGGTSIEDAVGDAFGCVREAPPWSETSTAARRALVAPARRHGARVWRLALAAAVILAGSGGAIAARGWLALRRANPTVLPANPGERRTPSGARIGALPRPRAALAPEPASVEAVAMGAPSAPAGPRTVVVAAGPATGVPRRPRAQPAAPMTTPAPAVAAPPPPFSAPAAPVFAAAPPALAAPAVGESELLARAFRAVRVDHEPQRALDALDEHQRRFPAGALRGEARLARLEALLASGRKAEARSLLAGIEAEGLELTQEMRLVRGELLAEAGRCAEALRDFDRLIPPSGAARKPSERALYGRASCRLRAGDRAGARLDLAQYLALYPRGRFHGEVAAVLTALPPR